ncbi:MAG: alpha/beta fold hydrolase [Verrucomicrobiota bacterium]
MAVREFGNPEGEAVLVFGGIGPNFKVLDKMCAQLGAAGYRVFSVDYPSTYHSIRELADNHVSPFIEELPINRNKPLHIVTLSMGGILTRAYLRENRPENLGRVVMIAPPNHGSEVADWLKFVGLFRWGFGPAGMELTTDANSTPNALGPANFDVGVIAGKRSLDPWFSWMFRGPHDGKVSVDSARLDGMADFAVVNSDHYLITRNAQTIALTKCFLQHGHFGSNVASN